MGVNVSDHIMAGVSLVILPMSVIFIVWCSLKNLERQQQRAIELSINMAHLIIKLGLTREQWYMSKTGKPYLGNFVADLTVLMAHDYAAKARLYRWRIL